ncbi:hypothetical protein [Kribbella flavida]|nr:hypothetical protein [Kribbella flavida]
MAGVPIPPAGRTGDPSMRAPLKASTRLIGSEAERLVRNLVAAAVGVGPTTGDPTCSSHPGNDVVVLRVDGSHHDQDVVYRYDGCRHNGTDDGSILRKATPQTAQQIFVGVHQPNSAGYALYELLHGPVPPSLQPR